MGTARGGWVGVEQEGPPGAAQKFNTAGLKFELPLICEREADADALAVRYRLDFDHLAENRDAKTIADGKIAGFPIEDLQMLVISGNLFVEPAAKGEQLDQL